MDKSGPGPTVGDLFISFSLTRFVWWLSLIDVGKAFISRIMLFTHDDKCFFLSSFVC